MTRIVFRMPKKSKNLRDEILATRDIGHSWVQSRKRSGMESFFSRSKQAMELYSLQNGVQRFKESGHLVFKSISALSRGILKQKKSKSTIHFNRDAMNTELLFQKKKKYESVFLWDKKI